MNRSWHGRLMVVGRTVVVAGAATLAVRAAAPGQQVDELRTRAALELYDQGSNVETLTFKNVTTLTSALTAALAQWERAAPEADRGRRREVAALFVLDLALADYRAGQYGSLDRIAMIEWGCDVLKPTPRNEFHRLWMQASYAVLQPAGAAFGDGSRQANAHLSHGLSRFPDDGRLRLAELLTRPVAWGLSSRPGARESSLIRSPMARLAPGPVAPWPLKPTLEALSTLAADPVVGPEARAHVGLIRFHRNELHEALAELTIAGNTATDPFVRNLAWLIAGLAYDAQRQGSLAASAYERAVSAIPAAKASATRLAAQWFLAGRREEASALLDDALAVKPPMLDPWQHVADMLRFVPAWMAELHQAVGHGTAVILRASPLRFEDPVAPADAAVTAAAGAFTAPPATGDQARPAFRSVVTAVLVDISVRTGNASVEGLTDSEFEILDNGVRQRVEDVSVESLPIDLSMVLDYYDAGTWGATLNPLSYWKEQKGHLRADALNTLALLRPVDRVRVITVENEPAEVVHLSAARGVALPEEPPDKVIPRLSYRPRQRDLRRNRYCPNEVHPDGASAPGAYVQRGCR